MSGEIWDPQSVVEAIKAAGATWAALPKDRGPAKLKAAWPEISQEVPGPNDFDAKRHFDATRYIRGDDGRPLIALDGETKQTVWAKGFERSTPPTAAEISHADKVAGWNVHLRGRVDLIDAVWLVCGAGYSLGDAAKISARRRGLKHPPSKDMVRVARDVGIALIVRGLNKGALPRRPADIGDRPLDPAKLEDMRAALVTALDALDPFLAALAHGDPITTKLVPVPVRHLYKAAQASAKILNALTTKPESPNDS